MISNALTNQIGGTLSGAPYIPINNELLEPYWFDVTADIPEPVPVLKQDDINICTKGNFSCITGQAKSRKTFLVSAMVGAFLRNDEYMGMTGLGGQVLYIDTEQSLPHIKRVVRRVHRIAGLTTDENHAELRVLCLRELEPTKRREAVESAIRKIRPTLCVIDGISDLMEDTNSNIESVYIASMLLRLTSQFDMHIITALHTNPGSDKARGHIGSEIQRKAETVLNVSKDGNTSLVKAAFCRDMDIQDFAFFINSQGLPELTEIENKQPKAIKLKDLFTSIVPLPNTMSYSDLVSKVIEKSGVKERQAKNKIKDAADMGILLINNVGYYHLKQQDNEESDYPF
jgi:hypothetical protein